MEESSLSLKDLYSFFPSSSDFDHLVDLFAGSLCVSLNYDHGGKPLIKTANEINEDITNFFAVLRDREEELIEKLLLTPVSLTEYEDAWISCEDELERARRFYIRVRQSFFGLGAQRKNKGWHMAKRHANCSGGETVSKWNNAIPKLRDVAQVIRQNFQITPFSYEKCISKIDHERAFFYCDPPYPKECRKSYNDYKFEFSDTDHEELAAKLNQIEGLAMVSSYDCDLMNSLYQGWNKLKLSPKRNNIRSGLVQEYVWCNYEPPVRKAPVWQLF